MGFAVRCPKCNASYWMGSGEAEHVCVKPLVKLARSVKLAPVKPTEDVKPDVRARVDRVQETGLGLDAARTDVSGGLPEMRPTKAPAQWRHRDPEAYRAYMREYMAKRRMKEKGDE